jgi:hypothetical protein
MRQGAGINYLAHSDAPASGEKSRRVATNGASGRLGVCQGGAIMRAAHAEHKDDACYRRGRSSAAMLTTVDGPSPRRACSLHGWRVGALRLRATLVPHQRMEPVMKILALTVALLFAASPVAAQQTQQALGTNGQTNTSTLPNTGIICQEEMVATFCNVATNPNNAGYGTRGGAAATSTGISTPSPAIPLCGEGLVPANELCN